MVSILTREKALLDEAKHAAAGSNVIDTQSELASVASAAVVKPNVDTLYSRVIIDLSQNDLVLTVPNISDRFYIFPVRSSTISRAKPARPSSVQIGGTIQIMLILALIYSSMMFSATTLQTSTLSMAARLVST